MTDPRIAEAIDVFRRIEPLIKGKHPAVQGAALASLLATHLCGYHDPEVREEMLELHIAQVRDAIKRRTSPAEAQATQDKEP